MMDVDRRDRTAIPELVEKRDRINAAREGDGNALTCRSLP